MHNITSNPIHEGALTSSKIEKLGVEIYLQDFGISLEPKAPTQLPFFSSPKAEPPSIPIIHPLTNIIPASSLFAILGGSGSGKTTLLNVLAGRFDKNSYKVHGDLSFSRPDCTIGYVTQSDFLLPHLTVRETLTFTAKLKISPENLTKLLYSTETNHQNITYERLVETVILDLGLKECADSLIGVDALVDGKRGISGGEKRRVSVGLQILTDPEVLCADEPTSGLDSFTAITLMESLKRLTTTNRKTTVVCSIHQPRADVFNIFDAVLILSKGGSAIYCGSVKDMLTYFQKIDHECPLNANPADFYVDLSSIDLEDSPSRRESVLRVQRLIKHFKEWNDLQMKEGNWKEILLSHKNQRRSLQDDLRRKERETGGFLTCLQKSWNPEGVQYQTSYFTQFFYLVERFLVNNFRDIGDFYGGIIQAVVIGLIVAGIFWQLGNSQEDVESREGLMYIVISMENYMTMIIFLARYFKEIKILDRELQDSLYHPVMYLLAHTTAMVPQLILQPILYSIPIYYGCNLRQPGFNYFLMFTAVNIALCFVMNGLVWMCLSCSRVFSEVQLLTNLNFTFISLTAGFLVNSNTIPIYVDWVQNISILSYAYRILMSNEFTDRTFCDGDYCMIGNDILQSDGVEQNDYPTTWPVIFAIGLVYFLVAALGLTRLRFPPNGSVSIEVIATAASEENPYEADVESKEGNETHHYSTTTSPSIASLGTSSSSISSRPEIEITVKNVNLYVDVTHHHNNSNIDNNNHPSEKKQMEKRKKILKNVNIQLKPGRLIALMGGSGSGKTTLLNLIANRIPHSSLHRAPRQEAPAKPALPFLNYFTSDSNNYSGDGEVLFNGERPSSKDVRYSIGYGKLKFINLFCSSLLSTFFS
jgi:ABC-type multidrug transport system ATPase subunit/ABC-type multidrug transport system permease subunit